MRISLTGGDRQSFFPRYIDDEFVILAAINGSARSVTGFSSIAYKRPTISRVVIPINAIARRVFNPVLQPGFPDAYLDMVRRRPRRETYIRSPLAMLARTG